MKYQVDDITIDLDQVNYYPLEIAIQYMCKLHKKLTGEQCSGATTWGRSLDQTKNPRIDKIAKDTVHGGRERFFKRHLNKLIEQHKASGIDIVIQPQQVESIIGKEMAEIKKIFNKAHDLMCQRNEKYGDSWKVMKVQSIANLCEMKLNRISNLDKLEPKIEDELIDTMNYCAFALWKLANE